MMDCVFADTLVESNPDAGKRAEKPPAPVATTSEIDSPSSADESHAKSAAAASGESFLYV